MPSDNPTGTAERGKTAAEIFGSLTPIGARKQPEDQPAPEPEPVEAEADAEEYDGFDDVDADEGEEAPETESDADTYVVRANGEEIEVTLDELLNGYSRHSDYTRKTQEVSELRKQYETERQQAMQLAQVLDSRLHELETHLSGSTQEPDWQKLSKELDPREYNQARAMWDQQQRQLQQIQAQRAEIARVKQAEWQRHLDEANRRLPEVIPEWKDPAKAQAEAQEITRYALDQGFAQEDIDGIVDPKVLMVLRKAWQFDQMQAKKPKIVKKAQQKTARAGAKKGATQTKRDKAAQKALNGPLGHRDAAAFFNTITPRK